MIDHGLAYAVDEFRGGRKQRVSLIYIRDQIHHDMDAVAQHVGIVGEIGKQIEHVSLVPYPLNEMFKRRIARARCEQQEDAKGRRRFDRLLQRGCSG